MPISFARGRAGYTELADMSKAPGSPGSPSRRGSIQPKFLKNATIQGLEKEASRGLRQKTVQLMREHPKQVPVDQWEHWMDTAQGVWFPPQTGMVVWDLLLLFCILYACVTVPFRMGMDFPAEGSWLLFEACMTLFFLADVAKNFNTAYSPDAIHYVVHRPSIAKHYFLGWFTIDFTSSLPLEIMQIMMTGGLHHSPEIDESMGALKLLRALRLLRLLRLLKLLRMQQYINLIEDATGINLQARPSPSP
jgi:hypothetical protein